MCFYEVCWAGIGCTEGRLGCEAHGYRVGAGYRRENVFADVVENIGEGEPAWQWTIDAEHHIVEPAFEALRAFEPDVRGVERHIGLVMSREVKDNEEVTFHRVTCD